MQASWPDGKLTPEKEGKIMDYQCVVCRRKVSRGGDWSRCHLWGAFATFHWECFRSYFTPGNRQQDEGGEFKPTI